METHGVAWETWCASDPIVCRLGSLAELTSSGDGFIGVPLRVGRFQHAWAGCRGQGAIRFLRGANGPGGLAHGGALITAVVDAIGVAKGEEPTQLDLSMKRPVPLLETLSVRVETSPGGICQVHIENDKGDTMAVSKVISSIAASRRGDKDVADISYDEIGKIVNIVPPTLEPNDWLSELQESAQLIPGSRTRCQADGPFVSVLDDRASDEMYFVDHAAIGAIAFGPACEGQPRRAHVGAIGAALDNSFVSLCSKVMGDVKMSASVAVTASFQLKILSSVPLGTTLRMNAAVERIESKNEKHKVFLKATLTDGPIIFAEATSLFLCRGPLGPAFVQSKF